jgi:hypothetical protein
MLMPRSKKYYLHPLQEEKKKGGKVVLTLVMDIVHNRNKPNLSKT